jgi:hypothetical protein
MAALTARNGTLRRGPSGVMRIRRFSMPSRVSSHADGWPLTPAERWSVVTPGEGEITFAKERLRWFGDPGLDNWYNARIEAQVPSRAGPDSIRQRRCIHG